MKDGFSAVAAILIASFVIDRFVTAFLFLLSYRWQWADRGSLDGSLRSEAEKKYKLWYFALASLLAVLVFVFGKLSVFFALGLPPNPLLDGIVTTIVLVAGSDRVAALLKGQDVGGTSKVPDPPIEIRGTVTLESPQHRN